MGGMLDHIFREACLYLLPIGVLAALLLFLSQKKKSRALNFIGGTLSFLYVLWLVVYGWMWEAPKREPGWFYAAVFLGFILFKIKGRVWSFVVIFSIFALLTLR